jgi:NAD(P)H-flavin reductase
VFGNRTEKDIYYHEEFLGLARERENFHYLPTLSRGSAEWQGLRGYVQEHVPQLARGRTDAHAYICGLDKMVKANRELLKSLGWDRKAILYEKKEIHTGLQCTDYSMRGVIAAQALARWNNCESCFLSNREISYLGN